MDLRALEAVPSKEELAAVDSVLGPASIDVPLPMAEVKLRRTKLLPALLALQGQVGWVSPGGLGYACRRLGVPPAEGFGVASFYALLSVEERPKAFAHVCDDIACKAAGAEKLCARLAEQRSPLTPTLSPEGERETWARSPCLGLCEQAPAALVTVAGPNPKQQAFGAATPEKIQAALEGKDVPALMPHLEVLGPRKLLARTGLVNPASLDDYRARGGYEALRRAFELGPEGVTREVSDAKLVGRGGAAFPTGRKWGAVASAPVRPHYVVCNADESEPGTFKDRVLLEHDPFGIIEAMTIAGYATGAELGYLYLRGEYPLAHARLTHALSAARARGLLGQNVMGKGFHFDIELRSGAGAYICGEETALFSSLEGLRGEPRNKPPFPVQSGLFGKPTAVNNVETLAAVLDIVRDGAAAYGSVGTAGSPGTKLFCLSGKIAKPGVYEVPFGTKLDDLLALAGGVPGGKKLKAVLLGGAAGVFVGPAQLGVRLSFEHTKEAGLTLGSGVVMVFDETDALLPLLQRMAAFFRDESCGQCVPCCVGTVRQEELLARLANAPPSADELSMLKELGQAMRDASICGLGQTASSAIESALALFKYEELR